MDDINYEPDYTELYENAGRIIMHAMEHAKEEHKKGTYGEFSPRQALVMGLQAGCKVVENMCEAELNIDEQLDELLGR